MSSSFLDIYTIYTRLPHKSRHITEIPPWFSTASSTIATPAVYRISISRGQFRLRRSGKIVPLDTTFKWNNFERATGHPTLHALQEFSYSLLARTIRDRIHLLLTTSWRPMYSKYAH